MNTKFYTYIHCKPDGSPFYVGKGTGRRSHNFMKRTVHHKRITAKYGAANISIWKFNTNTEQEAFDLEIYLIAHYKRIGMKLCNQTDGGDGASGYTHTLEACAKMSAANKARPPASAETRAKISAAGRGRTATAETIMKMRRSRLGQIFSAETRAKISTSVKALPLISEVTRAKLSAASTGKTHTQESRAKISIANKGKPFSLEHRAKISAAAMGNKRSLGRVCSEETRAKISASRRGKKHSEETRKKMAATKQENREARKLAGWQRG